MTDAGTIKEIEVDMRELDAAIAALELAVGLTNQLKTQFITCLIVTFILGIGGGLLLASFFV